MEDGSPARTESEPRGAAGATEPKEPAEGRWSLRHRTSGEQPTEEMPAVAFTRRRLLGSILFVVSTVAFLYFVLPRLLGLRQTWSRLQHGDALWLALGALLEVCSFIGYIALFRAVFVRGGTRVGWRASYEITMSAVAATRLLAAAGAGGIALTAWALRRAGLEPRIVACRMIAFLALLYGVFMVTFVIDGFGLYLGLLPGAHPFAVTVGPGLFGAAVIALVLAISLLPGNLDWVVRRWTHGRLGRLAARLATAPATMATGVRTAIGLLRSRDPYLLGAPAWWGFDIAVLWSCFHAFGGSPEVAVVVMAYFIGMIGNVLPVPGGIGGVDGSMIGAFSAFGVPVRLAIVAVLAYRVFAFWIPTLPGAIAYIQLRRTVSRWRERPSGDYT